MSDRHLPGLSLLDALRPPPGWRVDRALISTYSAEPAAIAAVLLALAGRDDESGSGSRVGLAHALLELRGRVAVVLQRGRLAAARRGADALRLLDRFIREVPWNEGRDEEGEGCSWHPKCAIVRMTSEEEGDALWRFHLGSRNLTRDLSWDIGLRIDSCRDDRQGRVVPGLDRVVQRLADRASASGAWLPLVREVRSVRWEVPRGLAIRRIDLMLPEDRARSLPQAPDGTTRLVAVSPFLDGRAVKEVARWGGDATERSVISTRPALATLARQTGRPLAGFAPLLVLPTVAEDQETPDEPNQVSPETAVEARGLHAKFLWAEHSSGATLWLGSANLTRRGWQRNAEIVAEIAVERRGRASAARELEEGIWAFRDLGETVDEETLRYEAPEEPTDHDRLDAARRDVAARIDARQILLADGSVKVCSARPPHPEDVAMTLSIGPVAGAQTEWPRGQSDVVLSGAFGEVPTELLVLRLDLGNEDVSWTQRIEFDPPLTAGCLDRRDALTLANWLGARGVLRAIRDLLDGTGDGDGHDRWDGTDADRASRRAAAPAAAPDAPTIEQVLKGWMRDPTRLETINQLLDMMPGSGAADDERVAQARLEVFRRAWTTIRTSLKEATRGT